MISYTFEEQEPIKGKKHGWIRFETDDETLHKMVSEYIQICADALSWRNRIERIRTEDKQCY